MKKRLETERLILRPLATSDYVTACAYSCDEGNTAYMMFLPKTGEEMAVFLKEAEEEWEKEKPSYYEYAVIYENRHIGAVSLYLNEDCSEGELGWIIHKDYWGQGLAAEAAGELLRAMKEERIAAKAVAHCDARNERSYRLMEKIGLKLEREDGIRYDKKTGEQVGEKMYSLLL